MGSGGGGWGSVAGGVIGGVIGAYTGNAMLGFSIGSTLGGMAGNAISPAKGPHSSVHGPRLGDLSLQSSAYGGPIPIIYGTMGQIAGNVIWSTKIIETSHESNQSSGGKGGAPQASQDQTAFTYAVSMAIGIAAGPIGGVKRMWANNKLVWDATNPVPNGVISGFRVYFGDETQVADPTIEAELGVGNVPAYRGLAYVVFTNLELAPFNNSVPNFTFEIIGQGTPVITTAATYTTTQHTGITPAMAIDTQTGLIWITYNKNPTLDVNQVHVIRPDTWEVVKIIDMPSYGPGSITYQPGYSYADTPPLINTVPARMWVGDIANSNQVWAIDTASYLVIPVDIDLPANQSSNGIAAGLWPMDVTTALVTSPIQICFSGLGWLSGVVPNPATGILGTTPWSFLNIADSSTMIIDSFPFEAGEGVAWPYPFTSKTWTAAGAAGVQEGATGNGCLYIVDFRAQVFKLNATFEVEAAYTASSSSSVLVNYHYWHITYNPDEDCVYTTGQVGSDAMLYKFDAFLTLVWARNFGAAGLLDVKYQRGSGIVWATTSASGIGVGTPSLISFHEINPADGTSTRTIATDVMTVPVASAPTGFAVPYPNALFMIVNAGPQATKKVPLIPVASGTTTLDAVVSDLSVRSALTAGDIDVTGLGSLTLAGYAITTRTTVRGAIEPLCRAFFFDGIESESKVKFSLRGATGSVVTIPSTEVAAYGEGGTPPDPLSQARAQEADLPNEVEVTYPDVTTDYHPVLQYARRLTGYSEEKMAFQIPVVVSASDALLIANVLLYVAWTERDTYSLSVMRKYAYLDPADLITYAAADGTTTVMRITKIDYSFPLLLKFEAVKEDPSVYADFTYAAGVGGYVAEPLTSAVPTVLHLGDWPLLREADDDAGFYVSAHGAYSGWTAASVSKSADSGSTYASMTTLTHEVTMGYATTALATATNWETWDDTNTVDVTMQTGTLASAVDDDAVLAGGNAAMLGSELIQFGTVTSLGSGSYRLSHLLRGRNGTEWAMETHAINDAFIVVAADGSILRQSMALAELDLARLYKGASPGQYLNDVPALSFVNTGVGLMPYAPVSVAATRDGSLNLTLTWIRRTRVGGSWRDYVDVSLGEDTESYSIDVMDGVDVVRTLTATTETVGYTAAEQITDFGAEQAELLVNVYQLSAQVGRGYVAAATV